ncbi:MAG: tRNA (adenosine(37)-N6)-threonylcarbamoyltransferase complex dimerization subunit type 1 TsaB [Bacteroidales bacterium]|nr:tRNA (adenosine(37)-N6)-threonylcarbamoyltransferase complex dimerization subunit type 1 TsaB [Bacteroidales bacterium]
MKILLIETSTDLCSVALCDGNADIIASRCSDAPRLHASMTAVYVQEVLSEAGIKAGDCDAVCVSEGPGSYTGLRVGVSTAKGLCFGGRVKLLSVSTLAVLAAQGLGDRGNVFKYIVPMIDARRMEVYSAVYDSSLRQISAPQPVIVDGNSYSDLLAGGEVLFVGDAASKCEAVLKNPNASFLQCCPEAPAMAGLAVEAFKAGQWRDVAYFEPFYLKDFQVTESKKKLF